MNKLLKAGFSRLKHEKTFWFALAASWICGIAFTGISIYENTLDADFAIPLFLAMSIFVSLSVGQEYSGSAIRNKIIVGHTKGSIFLTELILHLLVCVIMMLFFLIPIAIDWHKELSLVPTHILVYVLVCMIVSSIVFSLIFTVISCLVPQKALGSVICILLVFVMVFCTYQLEFSLFQPKTITIETEPRPGEYTEEQIPNPKSVEGAKKAVFVFVDSLMPNGQVNNYIQYLWANTAKEETSIYDSELTDTLESMLPYYPLYSIGLSLFLSYIGWSFFRKKDLK